MLRAGQKRPYLGVYCLADALTPLHLTAVGVARSGAESVKPVLQQLYRTRAAAYQEAVRSFVQVLLLFLCIPATI